MLFLFLAVDQRHGARLLKAESTRPFVLRLRELRFTWHNLHRHQLGSILVGPMERHAAAALDDERVALHIILGADKSRISVVDDHVPRLHCRNLGIKIL